MQSLRRTRPENLAELAIQVAIIRPGPIQGGAVNPYIERRQRLREDPAYEPPCLHPSLAGVLRETLGTIIFQDQVLEVAQAFAGFGPGEADGLRRAMSRKRASVAIERYRRRFIEGAAAHVGADEAIAQRVWEMVAGFAGFGFPKAHSAAFGLLAYQSTWLRVHYGPEFLCALLNEQPMGFYPPDSLAHEAQRRGIALRGVDVNASQAECSVEAGGAVRIGLGYVRGVRERGGRGARRAPARRAGRSRASPSWRRACPRRAPRSSSSPGRGPATRSPAPARRAARGAARCGRSASRSPAGACAAAAPSSRSHSTAARPRTLRELGRWEALLADYATSGVTLTDHALAILRPHLDGVATSAELEHLRHGAPVTVAGLVVARQRPETAGGVVFMLLEDEHGTVNLIVPPALYERRRHIVRAEPLILAEGRLERPPAGGGTINVLVRELRTLDAELAGIESKPVIPLPARDAEPAAEPAEPPSARRRGRLARRRPARPELRARAAIGPRARPREQTRARPDATRDGCPPRVPPSIDGHGQ